MISYFWGHSMKTNAFEKLHHVNYLMAEMDALYHQASLKLGISDSAMRVLYTIYDRGDGCSLRDVYKQSGIGKQTAHSALQKLEREGMLRIENGLETGKQVRLTEAGRLHMEKTAGRLYQLECEIFSSWTEEELCQHIRLMEKYADALREQLKTL